MKRGKPTKLTKKIQEEICSAISIGATYKAASVYAGITYRTFRNWLEEGERENERIENNEPPNDEKSHYFYFFHAIQEAIAELQIRDLDVIDKAAQSDPSWAWRRLSYRFQEFRTDPGSSENTPFVIKVVHDDKGDGNNSTPTQVS